MDANIKPLISFIIPCYNVENYVENCINSISHQNYANLEIITVDDGSTDNTGSILDKLSHDDNRIKVIHQKNGGVSSARNAGLEIATGEYVTFVDGDDYISPDYSDYMFGLISSTNAEFALSVNCFTRDTENQVSNEVIKTCTPEDATALLLGPRIIVGCWNKMYKRSLLINNNIIFSKSQFYGEGLLFITTVSQYAKNIVVGNRKVYYYRRNNYSSACTKFNIRNFYNGSDSIDIIENNLQIKTSKVLGMLDWHRCQFKMGTVVRIKEAELESKYNNYYKECLSYVRKHSWKCLLLKGVSLYKKGLLIGTCISPWLMAKLDSIRRKRIEVQSVISKK